MHLACRVKFGILLGDTVKDDGAETRLGARVSGNNGRINRKSLEKSLVGVNTAQLQPTLEIFQRESTKTHGKTDNM